MVKPLGYLALVLSLALSACSHPLGVTKTGNAQDGEVRSTGYQLQQRPVRQLGQRWTALESDISRLINEERTKAGLAPLTVTNPLYNVARWHSFNMYYQNNLSHELDGKGVTERLSAAGIASNWRGENIYQASQPFETVANRVLYNPTVGWMNSPRHRENVLSPNFHRMGVGAYYNTRTKQWFITTVFTD